MIVTLTTDYGPRDGYAAAVKGTMLSITPALRLVDVTHAVPPRDVMEAAFVLMDALSCFPDGTVHLSTVGGAARTGAHPIAARFLSDGREYTFVGPDNGMLALITRGDGLVETVVLDRPEWWRTPDADGTFEGRDRLGPVAAHLASGVALDRVGSPAGPLVGMHWPMPKSDEQGIDGWVAHIDRYGNCITNITRDLVAQFSAERALKCFVGSSRINGLQDSVADVPAGDPVAVFDSSGRLMVAINGGDAAQMLSVHRGASVNLVFGPRRTPDAPSIVRPASPSAVAST